jgi:hypothetical protein
MATQGQNRLTAPRKGRYRARRSSHAIGLRSRVGENRKPLQNEIAIAKAQFMNRTSHLFLIYSDSSGHRLSVDGGESGNFVTLEAAEAMATTVAQRLMPGATLGFDLDFKWTLTELEIRAATLECSLNNRSGDGVCGS